MSDARPAPASTPVDPPAAPAAEVGASRGAPGAGAEEAGATLGATGQAAAGATGHAAANASPAAKPVAPAPTAAAKPAPIPPARIAAQAGEVLSKSQEGHYSYNPGRRSDGIGGAVEQAGMTEAQMGAARVAFEAAAIPPTRLDAATARVRLAVMIATLSGWCAANPHPLEGELAAVASFFRGLETRRLARATATALGRTVEKDAIDEAEYAPPPEFYAMANAAQQFLTMSDTYEAALAQAKVVLSPQHRTQFDAIRANLRAYTARGVRPPAPRP